SPPQLLQRAAHGDRDAVLHLVRARKEDVYRFAAELIAGKLDEAGPTERDESGEYPVDEARRDDPLAPEALLRSWHVVQELHRALCELDERDLELVVLNDIEGLAGDQVAWLLNLSEREVYTRLRRARRQLRQHLLSRHAHAKPA
ncbi:MAG TPA: sigma factor-like helix-turn-helix DNA-binding protein, partial [Polyangiales bacterium]